MKYFLTITLCSLLDGTCVGPHVFPTAYPNLYSCQIDGYEKSVDKIKEIGMEDVNQYKIYTKFSCRLLNETW